MQNSGSQRSDKRLSARFGHFIVERPFIHDPAELQRNRLLRDHPILLMRPAHMRETSFAVDHRPLRFAIVGCWGVPGKYGGFETLAEQLARNLAPSEAEITIYGSSHHFSATERQGDFAGHRREWLPLPAKGMSSMAHDALQILHAVFIARHDRLLLLGASGGWALPFVRLFRPGVRIISNIDGLEWRREKFNAPTKALLKWLERRVVKNSDVVIADNEALVPMVSRAHGIQPLMIAYGGDQIKLIPRAAQQENYYLTMQRIEPENNARMILDGMRQSGEKLVFLGNWVGNAYSKQLQSEFAGSSEIILHPPVYDQDRLAPIRSKSAAYVHGHSVGGTNPSLVEALFYSERILAFDCPFNRATLEGEGAYFTDSKTLARLANDPESGRIAPHRLKALRERYRWRNIAEQYLSAVGS